MIRHCVGGVLLVALASFTAAAPAKEHIVRQLGANCGEDANRIVSCDVGLQCKDGTCQMRSFLSSQTVGCKAELTKIGYSGYVAVHDGFCYVDSRCSGLYDAVMAATPVTERLLAKAAAGSEAFAAEVAALSAADKAAFKRAEDICNSCAPSCLIGSGFLGRGGY